MLGDMPTRVELYDLIALAEFEALDVSTVQSIVSIAAVRCILVPIATKTGGAASLHFPFNCEVCEGH